MHSTMYNKHSIVTSSGGQPAARELHLCGPLIYVLSNRILLRVGCILMFIVNSEMKYSILRVIEPPVNQVMPVNWLIGSLGKRQNHINSVNLLRLIEPTPIFRLIGSKWTGPDVTLLSGAYCIFNIFRIALGIHSSTR